MVVDSSALVAVVFDEDEASLLLDTADRAGQLYISAPTLLEAHLVVAARSTPQAVQNLDELLLRLGVAVIPFDEHQADLAFTAWQRFGKGRHRAALNFGDCCSYALAKALDEPLLYKGADFAQTDIAAALG